MAANYKTVDGLKTHPLFQMLSPKQQDFLLAYIELGGNREAAIEKAYGGKRPSSSAMRLMRSTYIRQLMALYYGYDMDQAPMAKQELLGLLAARLRSKDTPASSFAQLVDHFIELSGQKRTGRPKTEAADIRAREAEPTVDALVQQIEKAKQAKEQ